MSALLPNALHVARREYLVRVRSRTYVISTILLVIAVAAFTLLPTIFQAVGVGDDRQSIALDVQADDLPSDPAVTLRLLLGMADAAETSVTTTDDAAAAAQAVRDGELDGLLTIRRGADGELAFEYLSAANPISETRLLVTQAALSLAVTDRLVRAGLSPAQSEEIFRPPVFTSTAADPDVPGAADYGAAALLAYIVVILTFMAVLTYGNWVAQSVAEEKSNRVMELLITAATPRQLLTGKVVGTGAAGLTQYLATIAAFGLGVAAAGPVAGALGVEDGIGFPLPSLEAWMLPVFGTFFLLGFLLYSTLYAAAGSMVSRSEDVQQAVGPLIFLTVVGYFVSFAALNDPEAGWVAGLSLVPFFSPYLMPTRMLLTAVSAGEVLAAVAILAVTLVAAIWLASRIYSAGVLLYGQRAGVRTVLRAARVAR